jgi:diguanylate cyclase (GGDEF)-like protein
MSHGKKMVVSINSKTDRSVPDTVRRRIDISQLTARARMGIAMAGIGLFVCIAVSAAFRGDVHLSMIYFYPIILTYAVLITLSGIWIKSESKDKKYKNFVATFQVIQLTLGMEWAFIIYQGIKTGSLDQRSLIYALTIGLMSTTMVSGPAKYGLAFWTPITIGAFLSLLHSYQNHVLYGPILVCLISYSMLSFYIILVSNRKLFERDLNTIVIEEKNKTIENILREYQDGQGSVLWTSDSDHNIIGFDGIAEYKQLYADNEKRISVEKMDKIIHNCDYYFSSKAKKDDRISLKKLFAQKTPFKDFIFSIPNESGLIWWEIAGKPEFAEDGSFLGYHGVATDISKKEEYRRQIKFGASRDYLTKLLNRASFNEIVDGLINDRDESVSALLCLDLDRFKTINDNFGHEAGDNLLIAVAQRLLTSVRDQDYVFRLGGDEFAIVMPDVTPDLALVVAKRIVDKLGESFQISGHEMKVGTCIGIGLIPDHGDDTFTLHRNADLALYRAKSEKPGSIYIFKPDRDNPMKMEQVLIYDCGFALDKKQFEVLYQPIISINTRKIIGCEALIRWNHPTYGIISPQVFIPILEQGGQISSVGCWVIEKVMSDSISIHDDITIAINLSPFQLSDLSYPEKILALAKKTGIRISRFEFEITETNLIENSLDKLEALSRIRSYGFSIALDDFGTGYSSLKLLQEFSFDKLKIDGTFIRECSAQKQNVILEGILLLGKRLGLSIVAEGIETEKQEKYLKELGCECAQGYYYYHPMNIKTLSNTIEHSRNIEKSFG